MITQNEQTVAPAQTKPAGVSPDGACPTKNSCKSIGYDREGYRHNAACFETELDDITNSSRLTANILLVVIVIFFVVAITWASRAQLDEVVRGMGKVIPSSEVKRIQNFEGGIVKTILVHEGEHVDKDQLLILLDQTQMTARFREQQSGYLDQILAISRLEAELEGKETIEFPAEVLDQRPHLIEHQRELMRSRNYSRLSALTVLEREKEQRGQELKELKSKLEFLLKNHTLLKKEVDMTQNMVSRGAASDMDLLKAQRALTELSGMIADARLAIPKAAAALDGATHRIEEEKGKQRSDILKELNMIRTEMEGGKEKLPALEDQMDRTSVRSPVEGTVKRVFVTTIGEAVGPGKELLEIVPRDDTLMVEAKVLPQDIAFLYPGQNANVKITAYDFSIYGSMPGIVEHISADAITDEQQKISYYLIKVRTENASLKNKEGKDLPIIAGMVAEVDVLTGKKTVLEYILKPIIKTMRGAMGER